MYFKAFRLWGIKDKFQCGKFSPLYDPCKTEKRRNYEPKYHNETILKIDLFHCGEKFQRNGTQRQQNNIPIQERKGHRGWVLINPAFFVWVEKFIFM